MTCSLQSFQTNALSRINNALSHSLITTNIPQSRLLEAMQYSLLTGGKRIRPLLVYATAHAIDAINDDCDFIACAVEMIHAYSLIHDDLPAMDDDDLRRGHPTCHIAFDEATAILAGDALQALAFEQLTKLRHTSAANALTMIELLARAAGAQGMVAGQSIDLCAVQQQLSLCQLEEMHQFKTGAMIAVSVKLAAMCSGANEQQLQALNLYSDNIGLAFQVQDDILDVESNTATLGKRQGADLAHNKPTYASLLGLQAAKTKAHELHRNSLAALDIFDSRADPLRAIANYIVSRTF